MTSPKSPGRSQACGWMLLTLVLTLFSLGCDQSASGEQTMRSSTSTSPVQVRLLAADGKPAEPVSLPKVVKTEQEWRKQLSADQYDILRKKDTEPAFCGVFYDHKQPGIYICVGCGLPLFSADHKFNSKSGWPSFFQPFAQENVATETDMTAGMRRTEILCALCDGHLGHVFDDGPQPTGQRYCLNSASLTFIPADQIKAHGDKLQKEFAAAPSLQTATFAAGCFWSVEYRFRQLPGVTDAAVGYMGGTLAHPRYEDVCSDETGHAEVVQVTYDPAKTSYRDLLKLFFEIHDPTTLNRQGPDVGTQYRSAVFFHTPEQQAQAQAVVAQLGKDQKYPSPIVTQIVPAMDFWRAEEYHQRYLQKTGRPACPLPPQH